MKYTKQNEPVKCIMTNSRVYNNSYTMNVKGILWHDTAAANPNLMRYVQPSPNDPNYNELMTLLGRNVNKNSINQKSTSTGVNAYIGKFADGSVGSVQTLPWDMAPWGCGQGSKGSCNNGWIQFEICDDCSTCKAPWDYHYGPAYEDYFNKVYREGIELTAYLCDLYGLDPHGTTTYSGIEVPVITCHAEVAALKLGSSHQDVLTWFAHYRKTMGTIRDDVAAVLEGKDIENNNPNKDHYFKLLDSMNMRETPNGAFMQVVPSGVTIHTDTLKSTGTTTWAKTFYAGQTGYVAVLPESKGYAVEVENPKTTRYFETLQSMNIRESINGKIVGSIPKGVRISGTDTQTAINGTIWLKTQYNGISGMVAVLPENKKWAKEVYPNAAVQNYYPKYEGTKTSVVDVFAAMGLDTAFAFRKKVAIANGLTLYLGTASQNKQLVELAKAGQLVKE